MRKSKAERAMDSALERFDEMQTAAERRFKEWEDERWKKENEIEERRRREDREHERLLMQMMLQQRAPPQSSHFPTYSPTPHPHSSYTYTHVASPNPTYNLYDEDEEQ